MEFIDLKTQQKRIKKNIDKAVQRVLAHGKYILGPEVTELEEQLVEIVGAKYCISCANGTDALQIALMAIGVGPGDEVIVPAFTYVATAEVVAVLGAIPVFVDITLDTYNIDPGLIESAITEKTRAIMAVSLFGQCPDFHSINKIASKHSLPVIEDGAQSFGATQGGKYSCNLSTIGCASFFPSKPLGCYGDGGAIFTSDEELAMRLRQIARHGQTKRYYHEILGVNSRLDTVQAAILLEKLKIFDEEICLRELVASRYNEMIVSNRLIKPTINPRNTSVYAQYTLRDKNRSISLDKLKGAGIPTAIHYPYPLHKQPAFKMDGSYPVAEQCSHEVFSIPMHPYVDIDDQRYISSVLAD